MASVLLFCKGGFTPAFLNGSGKLLYLVYPPYVYYVWKKKENFVMLRDRFVTHFSSRMVY